MSFGRSDFVLVNRGGHSVILWAKEAVRGSATPGLWQGLLVSTDLNYATEWDYFVSSVESGLPYDCMAQGELYGYFMDSWVVDVLGHAEREVVRCGTYSEQVGPLTGRTDPRWGYKQRELQRMHTVCMRVGELLDTYEGEDS